MKAEPLKIIVSVMAAAILTGASAWMVFGQDKVTRPDMVDYVQHNSPWVISRGEIGAAIKGNIDSIAKLERICERLIVAQQQLVVEQRVMVTKVEALLDDN